MAAATLIFILLLTNKEAQTSTTSLNPVEPVNALQGRFAASDVFALQIKEIRTTSEAAPVASDGNNLNVVPAAVPDNLRKATSENFQAISTNYSFTVLENRRKKEYDRNAEQPLKSDLLFYEKVTQMPRRKKRLHKNKISYLTPVAMVMDNCLETVSQNNIRNSLKEHQFDMEHGNHEIVSQEHVKDIPYWNDGLFKKRDANKVNDSSAYQLWLNKFKDLQIVKTDKRKQQTVDFNKLKTPQELTTTAVKVIPITTELSKVSIHQINVTFKLPVTPDSDVIESYTEDWFDTTDKIRETKIKFGGLPQRETYLIPTLRLEEAFYPFVLVADFFSLIRPFDFPIGLVKEIIWGKFTFPYSFLLSIKVESVFLVFIVIFGCMALIIPSYLIIIGLLALCRNRRNDGVETGALFPELEESDCNGRVLSLVTLFMILLCCALISGMAISNEQASMTASESRDVMSCACADVSTWLSAAARELHHSLVPPVDLVLQAFKDDLRNVDPLLGDPIQKTISSESGIDLVLESLNDVISESDDLSSKISSLRDTSMQAGSISSIASDKLKDLARQLDNLKKHCIGKDVPLCDTLNTNSLELRMKFDSILHEQQLLELRSLGVENLTRAIALAKQEFRTLPSAISKQTTSVRDDILRDMEVRRELIYRSSRVLNDIVRYLTAALHSAARSIDSGLKRFQNYDVWRWVVMLSCTVLFGVVMTLMICAMMCGCGDTKIHGKRTLQLSVVWTCLASLVLWAMISVTFLIAGHAEVYACHALWDSPHYSELSKLLDRPSPLFQKDEGMFDALFRDMENVTIDVPIKDVLRDCEQNRPAYSVFQLDKVLDVNKETSYFEWEELQADLGRLTSAINIDFLGTISAEISQILSGMLSVSDVNLAEHRIQYNGPVVGKDMMSLADQLQNVAAQVTDLSTSSRLETLASRTLRIHLTNIKPLEHLRADVVFKLTELELQLMPFRRKLNISLSHIHTAQYYIDNQGDIIAQKKVALYASRLVSHVAGWRTHVLTAAATQAARCRPLYSVFSAARVSFCSRYVASLHGWWICGLLLGLSWCCIVPLCVKLWRSYGKKMRANEAMNLANLSSGMQETPTTVLCDSNNWNTPGPPPPPRSDSW